MRIFVDQIGCRLNFSEMETLAGRLAAVGHTIVAEPEAAQVIVFNSCAVTAGAERDSRKRVAALHRASPAARIAVTGCWATLRPRQAAQLPGVTLVADNSRKEMLATLLEPWSAELDDPDTLARMQPDGVPFVGPAGSNGSTRRTRAFIKVQDGCNNRCTFCIVTTLRGESRSRPLREVITEVQRLAEAGVMEAVLTGVHLGSYGRDLPGAQRSDLKELVAALLTDTAIPRLRLSSLEPWELAEGFFDLWAQWPGRLCPHLHLPLQAGTDRQLRAMARRCTTASFRRLVQEARAAIPDLILTTDLIVGFPGESERDFEEGLAFVEEMRFAHAHLFPFSPRRNRRRPLPRPGAHRGQARAAAAHAAGRCGHRPGGARPLPRDDAPRPFRGRRQAARRPGGAAVVWLNGQLPARLPRGACASRSAQPTAAGAPDSHRGRNHPRRTSRTQNVELNRLTVCDPKTFA